MPNECDPISAKELFTLKELEALCMAKVLCNRNDRFDKVTAIVREETARNEN